ncbi:NACHT domain-containing protein [Mycena sanguinolenta]|uniref:NACHT domain-containing protein n=1 Tax=Mycena sanguinolenta TaxID=230812 RepID=A0A8H6Z583_9AGAR|nr:NACHT domain-containing protein [Mycena sanguinolenta]
MFAALLPLFLSSTASSRLECLQIVVNPLLPTLGPATIRQWLITSAEAEEVLAGMALELVLVEQVVVAWQDGERGIEILHRVVAVEVIHDSAESYPQPRCHPETRTKILQDLCEWALDGVARRSETSIRWHYGCEDRGGPILWLYGPAGAGKSAIMQSLCGDLETAGQLGGSFFFKCGHAACSNAKTLFATIAYQLAVRVPCLRAPIAQIVEHDPSIAMRTIVVQMRKLISEPCRNYRSRRPVTILIDGLDECEEQDIQVEILRIIRHSSPPFYFIIASRPEAHIRDMFKSPVYAGNYFSLNVEQSFDDVRKYLSDEFSRIHHEHSIMAKIPRPWPSFDILENLVNKSSGHFIYAATIIKFIDDKNYWPTQRLAVVLGSNSQGSPFGALDQLYMDILTSTPRQSELIPILGRNTVTIAWAAFHASVTIRGQSFHINPPCIIS